MMHNDLLDHIMPTLSGSAWKILCYIVRHTTGFHQASDRISYSQIARGKFSADGVRLLDAGAGVKSDSSISKAVKTLVERGYILTTPGEKWDCTTYTINEDFEFEVSAAPAPKNGASLLQKMEQQPAPPAPKNGDTKETPEKETETHTTDSAHVRAGGGVCVADEVSEEVGAKPTRAEFERYARNNRDRSGATLGEGWIRTAMRTGEYDERVRRWTREQDGLAQAAQTFPTIEACSDCNVSGFTHESILAGAVVKCKHPNLTARESVAA